MLTKDTITKILRDNLSYLASEYGVKRIGFFGSFAKGNPTEKSDIDIIVDFDRPIGFRFAELSEYLEMLLGRSVDVLTPTGIREIRVERVARSIEESTVYV